MSRRPGRQRIPAAALAHLRAADPVIAGVIDRIGVFEAAHEPDLWWALIDAIGSQQLSVRAAATIVGRVEALGRDGRRPDPERLLEVTEEALRACGLSRAKTAYVRDVARRWSAREIDPARIRELDDEAVIEELTRVKGVGRWTAEMLLIFSLRRPDVLPVDDLGLRTAVQRAYALQERPDRAEVARIGEPWRPYRSAATLYLWRSLANA